MKISWWTDPEAFQGWKLDLLEQTGLARDALHIYFGLTVFILVRLVVRGRSGWPLAWLAALCFALGGEALDTHADVLRNYPFDRAGHWHDLWNTMFWPTMLLIFGPLLATRTRASSKDASSEAAEGSGESGDEPLE